MTNVLAVIGSFTSLQASSIPTSSVTPVVSTAFLGLDGSVILAMILTSVLHATTLENIAWTTGSHGLTPVAMDAGSRLYYKLLLTLFDGF